MGWEWSVGLFLVGEARGKLDEEEVSYILTDGQDTSWMRGVSLAQESGGPDVNVHDIVLRFRKLLADCCNGPYSDEVLGFALALRIDGSLKKYGDEGVDRIRRNKKDKYLAVDICIPEKRWKNVSAPEFARYLSSSVHSALQTCVNYLVHRKVMIDGQRLLLDYAEAQAKFLGCYQ